MSDFETMPVGTAALLEEVGTLLRIHEEAQRSAGAAAHARGQRDARFDEAANLGEVAGRVEALLAQCPFILSHGPAVDITDARVG